MKALKETFERDGQRVSRYLLRKIRYWRNYDWQEMALGCRHALALRKLNPHTQTVLMVEPNRYHAEILPGYAHYFRQLGFDVVLLWRRQNADSEVFDRVPLDERPVAYVMPPWLMRLFLKGRRNGKYNFIFITSAIWAEPHGYFGTFCQYLGGCPKGRSGYAMVVHEFDHVVEAVKNGSVQISRISCLSPAENHGKRIAMINPHYFGEIKQKPLAARRTFITVGTQYRTFHKLIQIVRELERHGWNNFRVQIVGGGAIKAKYPEAPSNVEFLGRLGFPELYRRLESADFYLCVLDSAEPAHRRYLDATTSGARQLILGFLKVPIIHEDFARAFGLCPKSAILYQSNKVLHAMTHALQMADAERDNLRENLRRMCHKVAEASLLDLRGQIETS